MRKYLGLSVGIGACSMASHCMAYGVLGGKISERSTGILLGILSVILFLAGVGMIVSVLFLFLSRQTFKESLGKLILLFAGYLAVQLILGLIAGIFAWFLGELLGMDAEKVKHVTDLFCMVLQIPVRMGALLLFIDITRKNRSKEISVYIKIIIACAVYTICQQFAEVIGTGNMMLTVRGILAALLTGLFWMYVYRECTKEDDGR